MKDNCKTLWWIAKAFLWIACAAALIYGFTVIMLALVYLSYTP